MSRELMQTMMEIAELLDKDPRDNTPPEYFAELACEALEQGLLTEPEYQQITQELEVMA